ncbi:ribonuclease H protein [Dorcoceras hygrometricum]|uniref:Ribonuclease H protein n=1 Tax=Dorcoceras hygrometricum TaxID=472368 RepID=A0A2Z7BKB3_9LAMI|nr:ribonuclease H protein [Dorcoceras hygrometricum]
MRRLEEIARLNGVKCWMRINQGRRELPGIQLRRLRELIWDGIASSCWNSEGMENGLQARADVCELVNVCAIWFSRAGGRAMLFGKIILDAGWHVDWEINISVDQHLANFRPDISYLLPESFRYELIPNPYCSSYLISYDCRQFMPPLGARLVALGSFIQDLSFDTTLEFWVDLSSGCDVVEAFEHFRDYRPIVHLFRLRYGVSVD